MNCVAYGLTWWLGGALYWTKIWEKFHTTENIVKSHSPFGGAFDHLWNTQKDDLGYQYTKNPTLMTPEEKAAEFGRLWDKRQR